MRNFIIVTTCKGRLDHLKQTAPVTLSAIEDKPNWDYLVVDFDCPDGTRHWLMQDQPEALCIAIDDAPLFNKPTALNIGAAAAFGELGANYVVFQDADTIPDPALYSWIEENAAPDAFLTYPSDHGPSRDLTGFLVVGKKAFQDSQGFDVNFDAWGGEDIEFRLRLFLLLGYFFDEVPCELCSSIKHDDALRSQYYAEKNVNVSNWRSLDRLVAKFADVTGKTLQDLTTGRDGRYILRLMGAMPDLPPSIIDAMRGGHANNTTNLGNPSESAGLASRY